MCRRLRIASGLSFGEDGRELGERADEGGVHTGASDCNDLAEVGCKFRAEGVDGARHDGGDCGLEAVFAVADFLVRDGRLGPVITHGVVGFVDGFGRSSTAFGVVVDQRLSLRL